MVTPRFVECYAFYARSQLKSTAIHHRMRGTLGNVVEKTADEFLSRVDAVEKGS